MGKIKVSVVIVYYQDFKRFKETLESVLENSPRYVEVVIVDNSDAGIKDKLKSYINKIKYIKSAKNLGYGGGNNLGIANANGEYAFILNPDTLIYKTTISKLKIFLDNHKKVAIAAPNLVKPSGETYKPQGSSELTPIKGIFSLGFMNKLFKDNKISRDYWLTDLDVEENRKVDVVPGSALMIRKSAFKDVGGYDENMFLYFEESDIGRRLKQKNWQTYFVANSKVMHFWKYDRPEISSNKKHFEKSRFYYFKKHFGVLNALIVEGFAKLSKFFAFFLFFLIIASFFRLFQIEEKIVFHGELGHNYLAIKNAVVNKQIPLLGPPTSHEWLDFGPLYYWMMMPIMYLWQFSVYTGAYVFAVLGILLIIINYFVIKKIFNRQIALISSSLISVSPLFINLSRESRFFSLVTLVFYPFFYTLLKRKYFWAALWFGVMLNFHLTPLAFLPALFIYIYTNSDFNLKNIKKLFWGGVITQIPFLVSAPAQFAKLIAWLPYRVAKHSSSFGVWDAFKGLLNFLGLGISADYSSIFGVFILLIILSIGLRLKNRALSLMFLLFITGIAAIFLHGNPPSHYFLPIYIIPIIFVSYFFSKRKKLDKILITILFFVISVLNIFDYFQNKTRLIIPIEDQQNVTQLIINDAKGRQFELSRVGFSDEFEGDYAQNYQYLLWLKGNEPVESADIIYTIYEDEFPSENILYKTSRLVLTKNEN